MSQLSSGFPPFYGDRIQVSMKNIVNEYSSGKRVYNKCDIRDNWDDFSCLVIDNARFTSCCIEVCFSKCSFKNVIFLNCCLNAVIFNDCKLENMIIDGCSIEAIDFTDSILDNIKFGTNYAYGSILNSYLPSEVNLRNKWNT